ncbi:hypothetical protein V6N13_017248 [Hibiscus sabdariffa]|uniref:Uncharacterized protein n=1 Tax=Hibiscus sabdariffa TaxID=183260 RepID=A0ABR2CYS3_9ROSI
MDSRYVVPLATIYVWTVGIRRWSFQSPSSELFLNGVGEMMKALDKGGGGRFRRGVRRLGGDIDDDEYGREVMGAGLGAVVVEG